MELTLEELKGMINKVLTEHVVVKKEDDIELSEEMLYEILSHDED